MILHSNIIGEGTPMIVLHGFLGMGDNWKTLGRQFSELGYQVHLIDQRNHGRSFHDDAFSYALMASDLEVYCTHYQLDSCVLLGHSMGGKTAMEFATVHPELVSKLIVADIGPKAYPPHHQHILKALSQLNFEEIRSRGEAEEVLSGYISDLGVRQFLLKNLYRIERDQLGLRVNLPVLTSEYDEVGKALDQDRMYEGDALFIFGGASGYFEPHDEILIKSHFPKAKITSISGAGHWLHAEQPLRFFENVSDFLR